MRASGLLDDQRAAEVLTAAEAKVEEAVRAYEALPPPEPEEIFKHVFAEPTPTLLEQWAGLLGRPGR